MAERHELTLVARVPDKHPETITRFLDRGVKGIIVPHVETVEEARRAAGACYYGPLGSRSFGASRPHGHLGTSDFPAYLAGCNEQISLSVMIESRTGLEAIAAIAAVEGVDYITFGLIDLAQSLGCPGQPSHPTVVAAVHEATECVRKAGKAIREDFMDVAWIPEIIRTGTRHLLKIST
jgi:4-hydroxy-2-oxoheptanedioate aldolase